MNNAVGASREEVTDEGVEEDSEFFPIEASDSGLLEEIVHKFMRKPKPKPETNLSVREDSLPQQTSYDHTRTRLPVAEGFGFGPHGLNGFNLNSNTAHQAGAASKGSDPFQMMNHADRAIMEDILRHPELFNSFAARMQNA